MNESEAQGPGPGGWEPGAQPPAGHSPTPGEQLPPSGGVLPSPGEQPPPSGGMLPPSGAQFPPTGGPWSPPGAQLPPHGGPPPGGQWPPPQHWPPPPPQPRPRRRRLGALLAVLGVIVLAVTGLVAWDIGRSSSTGIGSIASPLAPAQSQSTDPASIAAGVAPGLVDVNTVLGYDGGQAAGTGIVLTANGEVLTNNHVVQGATKIEVTDIGNGKTYTANVVGYDRSHDVAVLQLQGASGLTTAKTGDSTKVAVGDSIIGMGNAGGTGGAPSVAPGTVTALDQSITASDQNGSNAQQLTGLIQVNANIQPGDSGGPLVNNSGQVIGMDTAASARYHLNRGGGSGTQGSAVQGFAIPINDALTIAHQIESGTSSSTVHIGGSAMLGVSVTDPGATAGDGSAGQGAVVSQVLAGGPAAQAGLAAGDVITSVDGQAVSSATALTGLMDQHHPGDTVSVTWLDQAGQQHTANAKLATGPVG
jgi:S1-C subfamily serine protease